MNDLQQIRDALRDSKSEFWDDWHSDMSEGDFENHWLIMDIDKALTILDRMMAARGDTQEALDALDRLLNDALCYRDGYGTSRDDAKIVERALTAQPAESVGEQPKSTWDFYKSTLERFVYETTHLSPQNEDGSHDCRISKKCLLHGRIALELLGKLSQPKQPDVNAEISRGLSIVEKYINTQSEKAWDGITIIKNAIAHQQQERPYIVGDDGAPRQMQDINQELLGALKRAYKWFEKAINGNIMDAPDAGLIMRKIKQAIASAEQKGWC